MLNPENLDQAGQAAFDQIEEAPWFQAHYAELGCPSAGRPARAADAASASSRPSPIRDLAPLGNLEPARPVLWVA